MTERDLQAWTSQGWRINYIQGNMAQLEKGRAVVVLKKVGNDIIEHRREGF